MQEASESDEHEPAPPEANAAAAVAAARGDAAEAAASAAQEAASSSSSSAAAAKAFAFPSAIEERFSVGTWSDIPVYSVFKDTSGNYVYPAGAEVHIVWDVDQVPRRPGPAPRAEWGLPRGKGGAARRP
jgi:hypothetical protein